MAATSQGKNQAPATATADGPAMAAAGSVMAKLVDTCKTFVLDRPETWRFTNDDSQPERKRKGFLNDCL